MVSETERARALLKSSAELLESSRKRQPTARGRMYLNGVDVGPEPEDPDWSPDAKRMIAEREAKEAAKEQLASAEVRRLTKQLRDLEARLAVAERHGTRRTGYVTTEWRRR